jgi:hypothetical protein
VKWKQINLDKLRPAARNALVTQLEKTLNEA